MGDDNARRVAEQVGVEQALVQEGGRHVDVHLCQRSGMVNARAGAACSRYTGGCRSRALMQREQMARATEVIGAHRRQDVVEQDHVWLCVHRPRERHACLLAAAQVEALLSNLRHVTARKHLQVWLQLAGSQDGLVPVTRGHAW